MANNYSVLVGVELDTKNVQKQLDNNLKNLKVDLDADKAVKSMNDLTDSAENALLTFQVANEVFRTSVEIIGSMVGQVFELDTALTEFKKVSDLSGSSLDNYVSKLSAMGTEVARTGSEMVESATEFRKNGFNDDDAAQLGQIAAMYQNVSDEAISAADSSSFIIAQLTAFGDSMTGFTTEAEKATHVIDAVDLLAA